jgi:tetratricopeptide (TPR) repeat protein
MMSSGQQSWIMTAAPAEVPANLVGSMPFPRRPSAGGSVSEDMQDATDDLLEWMSLYPHDTERYRLAAAWMAYRVALTMATARFAQPALHYFAVATDLNPQAPDMRVNYAVALHSLGREPEAMEQYEAALPYLDPSDDANIFLQYAILLNRHGQRQQAREILQKILPHFPETDAFWDLWAELGSEENPPREPLCPKCENPVSQNARFCSHCGFRLHPTS